MISLGSATLFVWSLQIDDWQWQVAAALAAGIDAPVEVTDVADVAESGHWVLVGTRTIGGVELWWSPSAELQQQTSRHDEIQADEQRLQRSRRVRPVATAPAANPLFHPED